MLVLQSFLPLFLLFSSTNAFYGHGTLKCQFTSSHDLVYLEQVYFNKRLMVQYNSTLGKYEGYTKKAKDLADGFIEPSVRVTPVVRQGSSHQAMLACSAYNFYPKQIRLTWLRNGEKVINYVTSTEELPDGNWLYQIHSYLEYTPSPREEITCMVEHASPKEPKLYNWEPMFGAVRNKIAVGTALLFGSFVFVAGLFFYKRTTA
ncbi:HLA class II histocompatibility antigen, DRB1-7 beta chain-like [Oryzias latipes]|uniref:HLA class II histocompatibility antigen, DRB1-7 beta chain-like n=1 Tax=Oryzias latipes TaxID=8090 RepID=UPI000CE19CE7|nr:HLA class II histocompatibility antigen, DRB1-7 beta chain-like [Oryzias latipes]